MTATISSTSFTSYQTMIASVQWRTRKGKRSENKDDEDLSDSENESDDDDGDVEPRPMLLDEDENDHHKEESSSSSGSVDSVALPTTTSLSFAVVSTTVTSSALTNTARDSPRTVTSLPPSTLVTSTRSTTPRTSTSSFTTTPGVTEAANAIASADPFLDTKAAGGVSTAGVVLAAIMGCVAVVATVYFVFRFCPPLRDAYTARVARRRKRQMYTEEKLGHEHAPFGHHTAAQETETNFPPHQGLVADARVSFLGRNWHSTGSLVSSVKPAAAPCPRQHVHRQQNHHADDGTSPPPPPSSALRHPPRAVRGLGLGGRLSLFRTRRSSPSPIPWPASASASASASSRASSVTRDFATNARGHVSSIRPCDSVSQAGRRSSAGSSRRSRTDQHHRAAHRSSRLEERSFRDIEHL